MIHQVTRAVVKATLRQRPAWSHEHQWDVVLRCGHLVDRVSTQGSMPPKRAVCWRCSVAEAKTGGGAKC